MKILLSLLHSILLTAVCASCFAQTVSRLKNEDKLTFLSRNAPNQMRLSDDLIDQMIETNEWSARKSTIGFYERKYKLPGDDMEYTDVLGYLYVPTNADAYQKVFIDTFENEGGTAEIIALFFANADKDAARELVVLIKWHAQHYQIDGDIYETRVYDDILKKETPHKLVYLKNISTKLSGGFEGYREGENLKAQFKTAAKIREQLKKLGY